MLDLVVYSSSAIKDPKKLNQIFMESTSVLKKNSLLINFKNDEQIVGYIRILQEDVGIMIKEEYQGKGIASRALELVIKEAKTLGISKLVALVKSENIQSRKIFEKNNFEMKMYWYEKEII